MRPSILARLVLPALCLAGCPTGEIVPHAPCGDGLALRGQGPYQYCAPADAGVDSNIEADSGLDAGLDSGPPPPRQACETCDHDAECVAGHFCIEMEFGGRPRPDRYCLPLRDPGCGRVFSQAVIDRQSTANVVVEVCAPDEAVTTCEAVVDMQAGKRCGAATDCGDPDIDNDGFCDHEKCTTPCATAYDCPRDWACGEFGTCERPPT